ncbi:heat shock protein DnaJ domain protein [Sulfuricurvum kujiense DSM 16994]|uniref:Heat shock protein DnaJ domain protein n=2 Tax=Sulfuricurvum kujiense TaxID=148813 RepID=E4U126_SULKY|nr:heat shock protein DnaJ domain protein [Sulfuricurvum kujiense DSM 16994]
MRIFANRNMILIHARRDSIQEKVIVDFVNRHFKYKVQGESGIFIHHCNEEVNSKNRFFHWLYWSYQQMHGKEPNDLREEIESKPQRPIKIKWIEKANIITNVPISIEVINKIYVKFAFKQENATTYMHNFLRAYFRTHIISLAGDRDHYLVKVDSEAVKEKLLILLKRTRIMQYHVSFMYNRQHISQLLASNNYFESQKESEQSKIEKAYKLLNVSPKEELSEIKKRCKKLLHKYHPDRVFNQGQEIIDKYTLTFQSIQAAFETIQTDKNAQTTLRAS